MIVATTADNLSNTDCQVTDGISIITLTVRDCTPVLQTSFLSFNARIVSGTGQLYWTTTKEDLPVTYQVERSTDGVNFVTIGSLDGHQRRSATVNEYTFNDRQSISGKVYYRIMMVYDNKRKYSRSMQVSNQAARLSLTTIINPFFQSLEFEVASAENAKIHAELIDIFGKVVRKKDYIIHAGTSALRLEDIENLPPGNYIFRLHHNGEVTTRKVMKNSH